MAAADQVAGQPVGTVAVVAGHGVGVGLLIIEIQEHDGNARLGDLAVIGLGRLAQEDQPVRVAGGHQIGKGQLPLVFMGQHFQQAEMTHVRQLLDELLAEDGVEGIRLKIPVRDQDADLQMLPEDQPVSPRVFITHLIRFFQNL